MMRPPFDPRPNIRLWSDSDGLAGYAWFEPPDYVLLEVRHGLGGHPDLIREMLDWGYGRCEESGAASLSTTVFSTDEARRAAVETNGFGLIAGRTGILYRRSLEAPIPEISLPQGYLIRHATAADLAERVACHRDAWSVWGPSSYSEEAHRWLRATQEFDETLDLVVEGPDGRFVSCCLVWADEANAAGHFEPVGTRPAFSGRGFGRAMLFEGMRRLGERGLRAAYVATAGHNARARVLYPSVGFEQFETELWYEKPAGEVKRG